MMPQTFADDFAGADGAVLNGRSVGGTAWTCDSGIAADLSALRLNGAGGLQFAGSSSGCFGSVPVESPDHYAQARIIAPFDTSQTTALAVRAANRLTHIGMRPRGSASIELYKRVGGTNYARIALLTNLALTPGQLWELRIEGNILRAFVDGARVGSSAGYAVNDALLADVTRTGLWAQGTTPLNPIADDFAAGTMGGTVAAVAPAGASLACRTDAGGLAVRFGLTPAGGRLVTGADAGAAAWSGLLAAAGARLGISADMAGVTGGGGLGPPGAGRITPVAGEGRLLRVDEARAMAALREERAAAVPLS